MKKIKNEREYNSTMKRIDTLMKKDDKDITDAEFEEMRSLSLSAQDYEEKKYTIPGPKTLEGMIELKMYEMKLNQTKLAEKLQINQAKLSLIMNGKQKPDAIFLKAIYKKLHIDPTFILEHI